MQLVTTTMDSMLLGGLYDHVGGGFFRYTTDERWLVPHFEKMLSDNALLIDFMTRCGSSTATNCAASASSETIDWLLREMKLDGAFAAGLDGRFRRRGRQILSLDRSGNRRRPGRHLLGPLQAGLWRHAATAIQRQEHPAPLRPYQPQLTEADEALLAKQRGMLLAARDKRAAPARDDKLLADWNGLAIRALAFAGAAFERPDWVAAAVTAFDAMVQSLGRRRPALSFRRGGKRGARALPTIMSIWPKRRCSFGKSPAKSASSDAAKRWVRLWTPISGTRRRAAITSPPMTPNR